MKWNKSFRIWRAYWTPVISTLFPNTSPEWKNSENFLLNSTFHPVKINREQILNQFGFLTALSMETEEQGYIMPSLGTESSPTGRTLLDAPPPPSHNRTRHGAWWIIIHVWEFQSKWRRNLDMSWQKNLKLYNLKGELLKSLTTKSGNNPEDIAEMMTGIDL